MFVVRFLRFQRFELPAAAGEFRVSRAREYRAAFGADEEFYPLHVARVARVFAQLAAEQPFRVHAENRTQIVYQRHVGISQPALPFGHRLNADAESIGECRLSHVFAETQPADERAGLFAVHFYHLKSVLLFNFKNSVNLS